MNCKPGDLAVIVHARYMPELLGHIVRVIRPWDGPCRGSGFPWECEYPDGKLIPVCWGDEYMKTMERTRPIGDQFLRPIRPDESPEESIEAMRLLTQIPKKEKV